MLMKIFDKRCSQAGWIDGTKVATVWVYYNYSLHAGRTHCLNAPFEVSRITFDWFNNWHDRRIQREFRRSISERKEFKSPPKEVRKVHVPP